MSAGPLNPVPPPGAGPLDHGALAAAVRSGVPTLGTFIGAASPVAAEVCAAAGVDWVLLDLEHGAGGEEQVRDVVPAAGSYGVPTVVRVESAARIRMGRVLDSGAAGIMLPRLNTVDEVAEAVRHLRYPPAGTGAWPPTTGPAGSASTRAPSTGPTMRSSAWSRSSRPPRSATPAR